ncbi:MAG TPA: hypothetical protein VK607_11710 [Kofleriaceae bacterium]|nr:hypothetical protein [Kofleriaceae bacterium]
MQDARWTRLKDCLLDRGWTSRNDEFYAPHATMWFSRSSEQANMNAFRDQISQAATASAAYIDLDVDHAALHLDLVSLVDALDEVLQN